MKSIYFTALCMTIASYCLAQSPARVADYNPVGDLSPRTLFVYNSKLNFSGDSASTSGNGFFSYDTAKSIAKVFASGGLHFQSISDYEWLNGTLYISADRLHGNIFRGIYNYDGISPVALAPGVNQDTFYSISEMKSAGGKLYFNACKTTPKNELWCYTGSGRATMINVASSVGYGSGPLNMAEYAGKLYFMASISNSVRKIYVLNPANNSFNVLTSSAYPNGFTGVPVYLSTPGKLYFISSGDTVGRELFEYDGSTIKRLSNFKSTGGITNGPICKYGEYIYFSGAPDGKNHQLYRYSTKTGNVSLAATINSAGNSQISGMTVYRGKLYFGARSSTTGRELWSFDGQLRLVADLCPGTGDGLGPEGSKNNRDGVFAEYNGSLYFAGNDCAGGGVELYRFNDPNGSTAGISRVSWDGSVQVYPNPVVSSANLAITLNSPQNLSISLTDVQGRQVWTSPAQSFAAGREVLTVPLQHLASGQYFFRVVDVNGQLLSSTMVLR